MKWCCAQFEGWHSQAGERGLGVFVKRAMDGSPMFVLQHRATGPGIKISSEPPSPVSLVSDIGIQFCPWCGARLLDWYKKDLAALERPDLGVPLG